MLQVKVYRPTSKFNSQFKGTVLHRSLFLLFPHFYVMLTHMDWFCLRFNVLNSDEGTGNIACQVTHGIVFMSNRRFSELICSVLDVAMGDAIILLLSLLHKPASVLGSCTYSLLSFSPVTQDSYIPLQQWDDTLRLVRTTISAAAVWLSGLDW